VRTDYNNKKNIKSKLRQKPVWSTSVILKRSQQQNYLWGMFLTRTGSTNRYPFAIKAAHPYVTTASTLIGFCGQ
jgi:hypothetical protein